MHLLISMYMLYAWGWETLSDGRWLLYKQDLMMGELTAWMVTSDEYVITGIT